MYKFNPQHIADLSGGKVILAHTKKEEDLPLLRAVIKETFPNGYWEISGNNDHYFKSNIYTDDFYCSDVISIDLQHLPIIPLHDFLLKDELPKEELDRVDLMDKRLKELEGLVKGNGYKIAPQNTWAPLFIEMPDQTADLIRWVLNNQDKVIKLKNQ